MKKYVVLILIFSIFVIRLIYLNIYQKDYYLDKYYAKTENYVYGTSAPRGRILDINGNILVDNIGIKTIYYTRLKGITNEEEIQIAQKLANIIDIDINEDSLKNYYLQINDTNNLITTEEWELYDKRELSSKEIKELKLSRITEEDLNNLDIIDKKSATIYELMHKGYSYSKKEILKNVSDDIYSKVIDANIKGITTELTWERKYNYNDTLKDIFGRIGKIPIDKKEEYLNKGYELDDIVGLSYLEEYYEDYLKGEKDLYKVNSDNTLSLVKEGSPGNDLVLSIDINVQLELERLIKENILLVKKRKYTDYFTEAYSIVGNPLTGAIMALSGQKLLDEDSKTFENVNTNLITSSFTVGSVVKMATLSTGYKYNIIDIGSSELDGCVKLYQVPLKCSYKSLGKINDLTAISKSSNYYQFKIAIGLTGNKYTYNMKLNTTSEDFNKFRDMFQEYGLGSITGIDLPNEKIGIIGSLTSSDLLLNLSIGQYDTYTPVELFQYVNTLASKGEKRKPQLMASIQNNNQIVIENSYNTLSRVPLEVKYLERLQEAMHLGILNGTSRNYIKTIYNPGGKTGTSETFIDTNNDQVVDTKTISLAFLGFAPLDNPLYSIVVLTPNIYIEKDYEYSKLYITRNISQGITNFLFENK